MLITMFYLLGNVFAARYDTVISLKSRAIKLVRLLHSINANEPMFACVSLFKIRQIKVFVTDHSISRAIESSRTSEIF